MKKEFDRKIDILMAIKNELEIANEMFVKKIIGKTEFEKVGTAVARFAKLKKLADKVEKLKSTAKLKPTKSNSKKFGDAAKHLMLSQKAYEAGIVNINSTFDAYIKMAFDFEASDVEKAWAAIKEKSNVQNTK